MMKRALDVLISLMLISVSLPIILAIAAAIWVNMGWPVIFFQLRPGFNGRPFLMMKFRTMTREKDAMGRLKPDKERLTALGRFLRSSSLDELPELWNVLRGEMSLVGPRPLLMEYIPLYSPFQARRHEVRPGITGWAQVNGRNAVAWEERLAMDVWYVDNRSIALDLKILWMTVLCVLRRQGISAEGSETMPKFTGDRGTRRKE